MYAIRNKKTKKWVYGTDFRVPHRKVKPRKEEVYYFDNRPVFYAHAYISYSQRTSFNQALTFDTLSYAIREFNHRGCGNDYEIVKVRLVWNWSLFTWSRSRNFGNDVDGGLDI